MEDAMDLWNYLFIGLGFYLAYRVGQLSIISLLRREVRDRVLKGQSPSAAVKSLLDTGEPADQDEETECLLERHEGLYYAYTGQGEFMAQGQDFAQVFAQIKLRFPGQSFRVNPRQLELTEAEKVSLVDTLIKTFGDRDDRTA
jgi:hypothetical protein